jgi:hypothetical protein
MTSKIPTSKVTIVEVAKKAQVSLGTVSRVINNDVHVAPETRERVSAVIQDMGYVANRQARGLKGMKTNVIGVLVPDLATSYIGEIMHGIDAELALHHSPHSNQRSQLCCQYGAGHGGWFIACSAPQPRGLYWYARSPQIPLCSY